MSQALCLCSAATWPLPISPHQRGQKTRRRRWNPCREQINEFNNLSTCRQSHSSVGPVCCTRAHFAWAGHVMWYMRPGCAVCVWSDSECSFFKCVLIVLKTPGDPRSKVNPADADIACTRITVRNSTIVASNPSKCKRGLCSDLACSIQVIVMSLVTLQPLWVTHMQMIPKLSDRKPFNVKLDFKSSFNAWFIQAHWHRWEIKHSERHI